MITALADLTGVRVMMMFVQRWSSRSSRVVFSGTRTPCLMAAGVGKMSLTIGCWAAMMSSMLRGLAVSTAVMLSVGQQAEDGEKMGWPLSPKFVRKRRGGWNHTLPNNAGTRRRQNAV